MLSLNEEEPHEKELGHVITIQLFGVRCKRKKIGISEVEKARSSFWGITKITAENPHTFQREAKVVTTKNEEIIMEVSVHV